MASLGRRMSTFTFGYLILCCVVFDRAASLGTILDQADAGGGSRLMGTSRHLLQNLTPCPIAFNYVLNFTNLEAACPNASAVNDTNYPKAGCCGAFADLLCPYANYVNDESYNCDQLFASVLDAATGGNITSDFIGVVCTNVNSPQGIPCPNAPAPAPDSGFQQRSLFPTGFTLLLAGAAIKWWHF